MRKLSTVSLLFAFLLTSPTLIAGGISYGRSKGILPSLTSIFKKREKRSKDRLLKQLRTNQARTVQDQSKAATKRPLAPKPVSRVQHRPRKPIQRRVSYDLPIFIPYEKIETIKELAESKADSMVLLPKSALNKLRKESKPKKEKEVKAPQPYNILDGAYYVVVEGAQTAELSGTLTVEVLADGYVVLPLPVNSSTALGTLTVNGKPVQAATATYNAFTDRNNVRMLLVGKGKHAISFNAHIPATTRDGEGNLRFNVPKMAMSALTLELPGDNLHIDVNPASALEKVQSRAGRSKRKCQLKPSNEVIVRWYKETARRALSGLPTLGAGEEREIKEEEKRPVISGSVYNAVTFVEGLLKLRAHLLFEVSQAPVDSFKVKLPEFMTLLGIEGPDGKPLKTFRLEKDEITIYLQSQRQGKVRLKLNAQNCMLKDIQTEGTTKSVNIQLPFATVLNCNTSNCFIGLKLGKTLQADYGESNQFTSVTPQDLPSYVQKRERKGYTCFKGLREAPTDGPRVFVTEEKASSPDDFSITAARVVTVLTTEKESQTKAVFTVVNSKKQFLHVRLPKGSKFQSLFVAGSPAKAGLRDPKDKENLLVPLNKSVLNNRTWQPFPVELVYTTPVSKLGSVGEITIEALGTDETINNLDWSVHCPQHLQFTRVDGSLEEDERSSILTRSAQVDYSEVQSFDLASNVVNMRTQAWSAPVSGEELDNMMRGKRSAEGAYPVRISLPETKNQKSFKGGDVDSENELPWLKLSFVKNDYVDKMQGIVIIVTGFSLLLLILRAIGKQAVKLPLSTLAAVLVFTGFIKLQFDTGIEALFQGIFLGLAMAFVYACFTPVRRIVTGANTAVAAALLLTLCASPLLAAQRPITVVVPFEKERLEQGLRNYENRGFVETKVIEEAKDSKTSEKPKPPSKPPTDLALRSAAIQGSISADGVANLEIFCSFTTYGKGWNKVPVIKAFGTVKKARLDTKRVAVSVVEDRSYYSNERAQNDLIFQSLQKETNRVERKDNPVRFFVPVKGAGEHELVVNIEMDVKDLGNSWRGLSFELPAYQERSLSLDVAKSGIKVNVPGAHSLKVTPRGGKTQVNALLSGRRQITVKWFEKVVRKRVAAPRRREMGTARSALAPAPLKANAKVKRDPELKPLVIARLTTSATLDETHLKGTVFIEYKVERQGLELVQVEIPANITITKIVGNRHKDFSVLSKEKSDTKILAILLKRKTKGNIFTGFEFKFALNAESAVVDKTRDVELTFPNFKSLDTKIESGTVGIKRTGNLEIFQVGEAPGLEKTERERLPKAYQSYLPLDAWLIYRYRKHPWSLQLKVREHPVVVGYTASIDTATFTTRLNRKGQGSTDVDLRVRNFGQSFLHVELAPGVGKIKALRLDNEEVTYMTLKKQKMLRIALEKPSEKKDYAKNAMRITFTFKHAAVDPRTNSPLKSKDISGRSIALYLPRLDLPIAGNGLTWTIKASRKQVIRYLDGQFRPSRHLINRPFKLFDTEPDRRISLRRTFLQGWPSGFDERTANALRVDLDIQSENSSLVFLFFGFLLSLVFFTNCMLMLACARRPWYSMKQPALTVGSLALLALLELTYPGIRKPVVAGMFLSPFLFIVWFGLLRWFHASANPDLGLEEYLEQEAVAAKGGEAK